MRDLPTLKTLRPATSILRHRSGKPCLQRFQLNFFTKIEIAVKHFLASVFVALFLSPTTSNAHPGVGIVCDGAGNIFFTDLKNVYKIAPDGEKTVAVANVHTHELALDSTGNLYGEHLWYTGERDNRWRRYVWRLAPNGSLTRILEEHEAFQGNFGFVRDAAFSEYHFRREGNEFIFEKTDLEGKKTFIGKRQLKDVQWLKVGSNGSLYFAENDNLWQLSPNGDFRLLAGKLAQPISPFSVFGENRSVFGIWLDASKNVYVALHTSGLVKKITPDGIVSKVNKSPLGWSPVGGVFDKAGNLWVLESTFTGTMRARKVEVEEVRKGQVPSHNTIWWGGAGLILLLSGWGIRRLW